jgi:hypothetical protein
MKWPATPAGDLGESEVVDFATEALAAMLGAGWVVQPRPAPDRGIDAMWTVSGPGRAREATVLVEAKGQLSPATASSSVVAQFQRYRASMGDGAIAMVVSPWLSPRTRQVLDDAGINYLDTTGNVSLRIAEPAVFIKTEGEQRNPRPQRRAGRGITGPNAGRVVRQLVDFKPPRRATELAEASKISEGYLSRVLDVLSEEALIRRKNRVITTVDWANLLRSRAQSYQLMKANHVVGTVARRGVEATLDNLRSHAPSHPVLMTGVMAANGYVPLVVGGNLMLYVPPGPRVIDEVLPDLGLLRAPEGATGTVQLLQPMSNGALDRPGRMVDGVPTVGLSQLVLDCLGGPGRLPAAGESLLAWMADHEHDWRLASPLTEDQAHSSTLITP